MIIEESKSIGVSLRIRLFSVLNSIRIYQYRCQQYLFNVTYLFVDTLNSLPVKCKKVLDVCNIFPELSLVCLAPDTSGFSALQLIIAICIGLQLVLAIIGLVN